MPSPRRIRLLFYVCLAGFAILLFSSHYRTTREADSIQDFYHKTKNALDKGSGSGSRAAERSQQVITGHDHDADGDVDADDEAGAKEMTERLRQAEQKAKENANAKGPTKPDVPQEIVGVGSSASGQDKKKGKDEPKETEEEHEVEQELNSILKKSPGTWDAYLSILFFSFVGSLLTDLIPVIIFSKSYCPHSKRAKGILLEKYIITPQPFVVELDQHPLGAQLQAKLAERTNRGTVPNVMVNGVSIGGGDETAQLDADGTLASKIKSMGGKRVDVTKRFIEDSRRPN